MRAVLMTAAGGPEVLQVAEVPEPQITGERDVKLRLRAAGVNPVDYKLRTYGTIGGSLPAVLGVDGAGVVEGAGSAVTRFTEGDEVYFVDGGYGPTPGTYQEVKIVDERLLARKPERLSFVEAAAAPLVTITAWEALRERARVERDQDEAIKTMHNRNLRVSFTWMPAPQVFGWQPQRERQRAILEQAAAHFDAGELRVQVGAAFPLDRAADAHRALEAGKVLGKAVLKIGPQ